MKSKPTTKEEKAKAMEIAAAFDSFTFQSPSGEEVFVRSPIPKNTHLSKHENFGDFETAFPLEAKRSNSWNGDESFTAPTPSDPKRSISWNGDESFTAPSEPERSISWVGDDFGNKTAVDDADAKKSFVHRQGSNHPMVRSRSGADLHGALDSLTISRHTTRSRRQISITEPSQHDSRGSLSSSSAHEPRSRGIRQFRTNGIDTPSWHGDDGKSSRHD